MQSAVCFVLILIISVATDMDVYVYNSYEFYAEQAQQPVVKPLPSTSFIFGYHSGDILSIQIFLRNEAPNLTTDVYLNYPLGENTQKKQLEMYVTNSKKYYLIKHTLTYSNIVIELELSTSTGISATKQIVRGEDVAGLPDQTSGTSYNDVCLKDQYCVIEVDFLKYKFDDNVNQLMLYDVLMYVLSSVLLMCAIIMLIYISVQKICCHRNSRPVETIELNTHYIANEVLYADLSLGHEDRQLPRRDEESPYAEIIGVLKHN